MKKWEATKPHFNLHFKVIRMVEIILKALFQQKGIEYEENCNSFIVDCGGNDSEFIRTINLINEYIEEWTYELELPLNIKIDTAYEKIIIEY